MGLRRFVQRTGERDLVSARGPVGDDVEVGEVRAERDEAGREGLSLRAGPVGEVRCQRLAFS